jgi:Heparinase II/III-like protein
VKLNRREFSAALLGAAAFPGKLLGEFDQPPTRPSLLLLRDDPFSGLKVLKARLEAGLRPSEDIPGWALSWQLTRRNEFAGRAIAAIRALPPAPKGSASRYWMQTVGLSLAFDWLYDHPAFDAALKDGMANRLVDSAAAVLAVPDLSIPEQASYHNYTLRYLAVACFALAAVRGHCGVAQPSATLRENAQRAFSNILETTQLVTPQGSYHESMDYFRITLAPLALLAELRRTSTAVDPALHYSVLGSIGATYLYKLLPDGTPSREGDNEYPLLDDRDTALLGYAVHRFKDPYSAWLLRNSGFVPAQWVLPVLEFLWNDPEVTPRDPALAEPAELPRQRFFSGVGHLVMRSGWKPDSTWIEFDCGPYFSKHQHLSQNHFSIYHRGYLAIDSGADYTDTESPHYLNYYRRTVAHNSVLVYDPREKFFWSDNVVDAANDGGQRMDSARYWNTVRSLDDWEGTRDLWNLGAMRVVDYQPGGYHYALGDATAAYSAAKLKRFTRELLYIPSSNILFVFDRVVSTNPDFRKVWLLHGVSEPAFVVSGQSGPHGATNYADASEFRFADADSELLAHCLLPERRTVTKRGGQGNEFWTPGNERGSEWGSGENWPLEPAEGGPLPGDPRLHAMWKKFWGDDFQKLEHSNRKNVVPGAWRVEVSPATPATEDHFLHLLEIGGRGNTGKHRVELLHGQNVAGAAFESGPMALFNTGASPLTEGEVTLPAITCRELYISGLKENALYQIIFSGPNITTPASIAGPGIAVKTEHVRSNDKGILSFGLEEGHTARMRFRQV